MELGDRVRKAKFAEGAAWGRRETRVSARAVLEEGVRVGRVGRRWLPLPLAKIPLARLWGGKCRPAEGEAGSVTVGVGGNIRVVTPSWAVRVCASIHPKDVVKALRHPYSEIVLIRSHQPTKAVLIVEEAEVGVGHEEVGGVLIAARGGRMALRERGGSSGAGANVL